MTIVDAEELGGAITEKLAELFQRERTRACENCHGGACIRKADFTISSDWKPDMGRKEKWVAKKPARYDRSHLNNYAISNDIRSRLQSCFLTI